VSCGCPTRTLPRSSPAGSASLGSHCGWQARSGEDGDDMGETLMDQACAWLTANDIEPTGVPIYEVPTITDGTIRVRVYRRGEGGGIVIDGDHVAVDELVKPLKAQPPAALQPWLKGIMPGRRLATAKPCLDVEFRYG